ncbi:MAG TPA: metallophosphoesterase family protein [Thermoleophilaceae bacterium]|nr:metallophosphoesterase family protein [Thermoleophilaceae bacterium]
MLALLYDVHGNLPALEAVVADADRAGARRFLLGGDYALFGAWPRETVERLRGLDADWIRGNGERWSAQPADAPEEVRPAIERCRELLGGELVEELARLPESLVRAGTLFCHGSPVSDVRSFFPQPAEDERELLDGVGERRVVFGHTHLQFTRTTEGGKVLLNPGSVGMPFDGDPRAGYGLLHDDGRVELRRVAYDHGASAKAVRRVLGPAGETPAGRIERAQV